MRVCLVPTPQSWGSISMQRCFEVLLAEAAKTTGQDPEIRPFVPFQGLTVGRAGRLARAWEMYGAYPLRALLGPRTDVVHHLSHGSGHISPWFRGRPAVVATVHDLIPLTPEGGLTAGQLRRARARFSFLKKAQALVAVSRFTAGQIEEFLGVAPERIHVVPNGVDHDHFSEERPLPEGPGGRLDGGYLLSVSSALPRKNLALLPRILEELKQESGESPVLVRAGERLPADLRDEIERVAGAGRFHELGRVSDDVLAALYRHAGAFLFLSLQEGFGLPVLEAMASGCPVVCSDATSLPEVGGDAVLYADPSDPAEAARQVSRALGSERSRLVQEGALRAAEFTWERHFQELLRLYRRLHEAQTCAS